MRTFSPSAWLKGEHWQQDTISAADIGNWVAEMKVAPSLQAVRMFYGGLFPTFIRALQEKMPGEKELRDKYLPEHRARLADIENFLKGDEGKEGKEGKVQAEGNKGLAFVLNDAIGITQELNAIREDAFAELHAWLDIHEYAPRAIQSLQCPPVSNEHKVKTLFQINWLKSTVQATITESKKKKYEEGIGRSNPFTNKQGDERIRDIDHSISVRHGWTGLSKEEAWEMTLEIEKLQDEKDAILKEKAETIESLWSAMTRHLDIGYTETFHDQYYGILTRLHAVLDDRGDDHIAWVESQALQDAYALYDKEDPGSGAAFFDQTGKALEGMANTSAGAKLLEDWLENGNPKDPRNLLLRGLCCNQRSVEEAAAKGFADFAKAPDKYFRHETLHPIDWFYKIGLGVFKDLAKETDRVVKMLQEVPRDASVPPNVTWLKNHPFWGAGLGLIAQSTARAVSFQMRQSEKRIAQKVLLFTAATLGEGTIKAVFGPAYETDARLSNLQQGFVDKVKKTADVVVIEGGLKRFEHIVRPADGDWIRVRMAGIVLAFEAVTLMYRAQQFDRKDTKTILMLSASAFACVAAGAELYANRYRVVTRVEISQAVDADAAKKIVERARVSYGAAKSVVAGFSTVAGGIGAYLDYTGAAEAGNKGDAWLAGLLAARGAAQTVMTIAGSIASYGDTEAFFLSLKQGTRRVIPSTLLGWLAQGAKWANGAKVIAYRVGAMAGWIGILLTIGILVYDYRRGENKLTEWCARSCFRKFGRTPAYATPEKEAEALIEAINLTFSDESKEADTVVPYGHSSGGA